MTGHEDKTETIYKDAMGKKEVLRITIPAHTGNVEEIFQKAGETLRDNLDAISNLRTRTVGDMPQSVAGAYSIAMAEQSEHPDPLSTGDFMSTVAARLEGVMAHLGTLPEEEADCLEALFDRAFQAGSAFRASIMRDKHLVDVEREEKMKKARSLGGIQRGMEAEAENRKLFEFMQPRVEGVNGTKPKPVKEVARLAAKAGLGAQKGDVEKDAEANRKRYSNYKKRMAANKSGWS